MRGDTVRCAVNRSDGVFTLARGLRVDRVLKNFAAPHVEQLVPPNRESGGTLKRQKPQRLLAAAFDICFDKCCLLKFLIPLAINHLQALYGGEGGIRTRGGD